MSRENKTSQKNRTSYIYYTAEGDQINLTPGENGVTEADILLLHQMDDEEYNAERRYQYRVSVHLESYQDGDGDDASDRNGYLADLRMNPESVYMEEAAEREHQRNLTTLASLLSRLTQEEQELIQMIYLEKRTRTSIAEEKGVSETAIRKRLKQAEKKLQKYFSEK